MKIKKYQPKVTPCPFEWTDKQLADMGGYNPKTDKLAPFKQADQWVTAEDLLWNMTLAIEAGHCSSDTLLRSFFKSREEGYHVAALVEAYGEEGFWVNERIFHAFFAIHSDESRARTFDDLAEYLREQADEEFPRVAKKRA